MFINLLLPGDYCKFSRQTRETKGRSVNYNFKANGEVLEKNWDRKLKKIEQHERSGRGEEEGEKRREEEKWKEE